MPFDWLFNAVGGGPLGIVLVILSVVSVTFYLNLIGQIKERREENKELRAALGRLTDVVESWTPDEQRRRIKRP